MTRTFASVRGHMVVPPFLPPGAMPGVSIPLVGRPEADVTLFGPAGSVPFTGVLVDTGASLLMFPASFAAPVGLSLAAGHVISTTTGAGATAMTLLTGVTVEVEGVSIVTDVLFNPHPASPAVLGRNALFAALGTVGFDATAWHW